MSGEWQPVAAPAFFEQAIAWGLALPHCRALGLRLKEARLGHAILELPFKPELIGDDEIRVLHGGVITSLADSTGAVAVFTLLTELESVATLDLRIDYLRPGQADAPLYCASECYRLTPQIAFTRSFVYQNDVTKPIAQVVASYMRTPNGGRP